MDEERREPRWASASLLGCGVLGALAFSTDSAKAYGGMLPFLGSGKLVVATAPCRRSRNRWNAQFYLAAETWRVLLAVLSMQHAVWAALSD